MTSQTTIISKTHMYLVAFGIGLTLITSIGNLIIKPNDEKLNKLISITESTKQELTETKIDVVEIKGSLHEEKELRLRDEQDIRDQRGLKAVDISTPSYYTKGGN